MLVSLLLFTLGLPDPVQNYLACHWLLRAIEVSNSWLCLAALVCNMLSVENLFL